MGGTSEESSQCPRSLRRTRQHTTVQPSTHNAIPELTDINTFHRNCQNSTTKNTPAENQNLRNPELAKQQLKIKPQKLTWHWRSRRHTYIEASVLRVIIERTSSANTKTNNSAEFEQAGATQSQHIHIRKSSAHTTASGESETAGELRLPESNDSHSRRETRLLREKKRLQNRKIRAWSHSRNEDKRSEELVERARERLNGDNLERDGNEKVSKFSSGHKKAAQRRYFCYPFGLVFFVGFQFPNGSSWANPARNSASI